MFIELVEYTPNKEDDWYAEYQKVCARNARFHCIGCGRFIAGKKITYRGDSYFYNCSSCGDMRA